MATESEAKDAYLSIFDTMLGATGTTTSNLKFINSKFGVDFEYKEYRVQIGNEYVAIIDNGDDSKAVRYSIILRITGTDYIKRFEILAGDFSTRETSFLADYTPVLEAEYDQAVSMAEQAEARLENNLNNQ